MSLFFYILSRNNLYSGLKGLKDSKIFKLKGLRSFLRDLIEPFVSFENFVFKKK